MAKAKFERTTKHLKKKKEELEFQQHTLNMKHQTDTMRTLTARVTQTM